MTPEEFREAGHRLVDWVAEYRTSLEARPVMSRSKPGEITAQFAAAPPREKEGFENVAADLEKLVMPGITHWNHPGFFAYFPSNMPLSSVLAELAIAGIGAQCMSWQTSPAATEVEDVMMEWLRQMLGLPAEFAGVIHDTASTATLVALLCARERTTDYGQNRGGLQAEKRPLIVYTSAETHSCAEKAALLAGMGRKNVRAIPTDADFAMRADLLEAAVEDDVREGNVPCAVVATAGTTATTALDPIAHIAEIAKRCGIWLHVDAAMAGVATILPECRWMWDGAERADSIVLNPHKWLGAGCDFSAYYARDPEHLVRVMSTHLSILKTAHDAQVRNLRDWGIPLGRRFRALKLWFLLRDQGVAGLQERLRRDIANAQWLKVAVDGAEGWERIAPVHLQTVCMRHVPAEFAARQKGAEGAQEGGAQDGQHEAAIAAHNLRIADTVNRGGRAYVTPSLAGGKQMIRVSIGAETTERRHVEMVWEELQRASQEG